MVTIRLFSAGLGVLGMVGLAGCCGDKCDNGKSKTVQRTSCNECDDRAVAVHQGHHGQASISGQPISRDYSNAETDDVDAGRTSTTAGQFRDVDIQNLSRDGNIWVGGEPGRKGYSQLHDRGVMAVVDLRNSSSGQARSTEEARRLGLDYINVSIDPKNLPTDKADTFLNFMRKHEGHQVLIHCGSANRASAMYAVYLGSAKGLSTDEAINRAQRTGLREDALERDVRNYLNQRTTTVNPNNNIATDDDDDDENNMTDDDDDDNDDNDDVDDVDDDKIDD